MVGSKFFLIPQNGIKDFFKRVHRKSVSTQFTNDNEGAFECMVIIVHLYYEIILQCILSSNPENGYF